MRSYKKIKTLRSHTDLARFLNNTETYCMMPKFDDIPSPYAYSEDTPLYIHPSYGLVFIVETDHRKFTIFKYIEE